MTSYALRFAFCLVLSASAAQAQDRSRVTGTVQSFDGSTLTVKTADGGMAVVSVPDGVKIGAVEDRKLEDIKAGEFVGSAAIPGPDGKLHAKEVHIFPEAMRGTGEGNRPMSEPNQTMTNATVAQVVASPKGRQLELSYKGGEKTIVVDDGVRVVELVGGDRSLLKQGAAVVVFLAAGGGPVARAIQAERNGVKPLM